MDPPFLHLFLFCWRAPFLRSCWAQFLCSGSWPIARELLFIDDDLISPFPRLLFLPTAPPLFAAQERWSFHSKDFLTRLYRTLSLSFLFPRRLTGLDAMRIELEAAEVFDFL